MVLVYINLPSYFDRVFLIPSVNAAEIGRGQEIDISTEVEVKKTEEGGRERGQQRWHDTNAASHRTNQQTHGRGGHERF